jgi:hypothetical protein
MLLLTLTVAAGAAVSTTTYAVFSRVGTRTRYGARPEWSHIGSPGASGPCDAVHELAFSIGVEPSRIDVTFTKDHEVHCLIRADPSELLDLATATEAMIDQAFRERHRWTGLCVVLHTEA